MELTIKKALQQGIAAHKEGKLKEAKQFYRAILQSQPAHPDANHNLGVLAVSVNKADLALPLFKTAVEGNPKIEQFWLSYIGALIKERQFDNAKVVLEQTKKQGVTSDKLDILGAQLASINKQETVGILSPSQQQLSSLLEHYQNGRLDDAEKLAVSLTKRFPQNQLGWKVVGAILQQTGRVRESLVQNQKVAALFPQDADAHYNLGSTLQELGRLDEAEASYTQAIALKFDFAEAHSNLGNTLKELGRLDEAEASLRQAIVLKSHVAEVHYNLGITLKEIGRLDEALASYRQSIALKPDFAEAYNSLGITLNELGKFVEAEVSYRQAIALKPDYADAHYNLGNTLQRLERLDEAEASFIKAIALKPDFAQAHNNLGNTLQELERFDEAKDSYIRAVALNPDYVEAYSNLGVTQKELGELDEAEGNCRRAIELKSDVAKTYRILGDTLQELGRLDEAEASYRQAIVLKPDDAEFHHNLGVTLLNSGRLKEGLDEYEWRWKKTKKLSAYRQFPQPLWDGQKSLRGKKILLWSEQGIGDTINWSSCLPLVASLAGHTILECQEKIVPLLTRSFPNIEIKPEDRSMDSMRDDFDFHLPMGSLYRQFIANIGQNSNIDSYLIPDPVRVKFWRDRLGSLGEGPYIGISWKSSEVSLFRLKHYPSLSEWSSVLTVPDVTFINLQYSNFADDLTDIKKDIGVTVHNFDDLDQYNDVDDVAALCSALDMVVSTKVTPLIFSSGVGTPTKVANWRQSCWNNVLYNPVCSSIEMFHRDTWEPWDKVFNSIAEKICNLKNKTTASVNCILQER